MEVAECPVRHKWRGTGDAKLSSRTNPRNHPAHRPNLLPLATHNKADDICVLDVWDVSRWFTGCYIDQAGCELYSNLSRQIQLFLPKLDTGQSIM